MTKFDPTLNTKYYARTPESEYSSVGRAPDCRCYVDIGRSLVRIRVFGGLFILFLFLLNYKKHKFNHHIKKGIEKIKLK